MTSLHLVAADNLIVKSRRTERSLRATVLHSKKSNTTTTTTTKSTTTKEKEFNFKIMCITIMAQCFIICANGKEKKRRILICVYFVCFPPIDIVYSDRFCFTRCGLFFHLSRMRYSLYYMVISYSFTCATHSRASAHEKMPRIPLKKKREKNSGENIAAIRENCEWWKWQFV